MIFVTVGTHEQQFNRLIKCVDELKASGVIEEEVMMQTGFSDYIPGSCKWQKLFGYEDMQRWIREADIVITHGGPASFISVLQAGKMPIVVPRKSEYGEHVNDHQIQFCKAVEEKYGNLILIDDVEELKSAITDYSVIVETRRKTFESNNAAFIEQFKGIVSDLMG